jgi:hypothetical protein
LASNSHLAITVVNTNAACAPVTHATVAIWQCDAAGNCSEYRTLQSATFLRGVQPVNGSGTANFVTVYPGRRRATPPRSRWWRCSGGGLTTARRAGSKTGRDTAQSKQDCVYSRHVVEVKGLTASPRRNYCLSTAVPSHLPAGTVCVASLYEPAVASCTEVLPCLKRGSVRLREVRVEDAAALTELFKDPEVSQFLSPPPATPEEFTQWIELSRARHLDERAACFTVFTGDDEVTGLFLCVRASSAEPTAEIGFALSRKV